jgi:hypothetical protein
MITFLAEAAAAAAPTPFPWEYVTSGAGTFLLGLLTWLIRNRVSSQRLQDALVLLSTASATGVRVAWETYTKEKKDASADGTLTDEEVATARRKAFEAAVASIGSAGMKVVKSALKDGVDEALKHSLEAEYAEFKQDGKAGAAAGAPANPPVPPGTPA